MKTSRGMDLAHLRPIDLCQLVNSTPLGEAIDTKRLRDHRIRAGRRIGDGRTVDLIRYVGWLAKRRADCRRKMAATDGKAEDEATDPYAAHRERAAAHQKALSASGRNIGPLPPVEDPARKAASARDFQRFATTYFPQTFNLPWSDDHLEVISRIEIVVLEGGLYALAMPRGSGKTSLCEVACLWAIAYGHREFVCLIGADESAAEEMIESIKSEVENNDLLLADFPEICYPVRCLDGIHQRAAGQLFEARPTQIGWKTKEIILPTIRDAPSSGAIVRVAGLTGRIRGMKFKRPDGESVRPTLVLVDDPQTDESARSVSQCQARERIISGAVLGLAGPGKKISALMPLTVVVQDDMADRVLNLEKHPEWQGERTKMMYEFPTNRDLWDKYSEIWRAAMIDRRPPTAATEFYANNREAMDDGAHVAWPARFEPDELSAIQHAMNLLLKRGDHAFWAEYQNEPLPDDAVDDELPSADAIMRKLNHMDRGAVPIGCNRITMFTDVQQKSLFYALVAWEDNFTGYIVDYGTEPEQPTPYFSLRDIRRTLAMETPNAGLEGSIYAGLERLHNRKIEHEWKRDDGAMLRIDRCVIDANWGTSTDTVYQFCRQSTHSALILPGHGRYVGASSTPFSEYRRNRGDRVGLNWRIPLITKKRAVRHILYDTNYWKSFVMARLLVSIGDPGCMSLWGQEPRRHQLFAEHMTAEYRVKTQGRGREVDEWKLRVQNSDNHWLDCVVGAAVAASLDGCTLHGDLMPRKQRRRIKLSELREQRRS